VGGILSGVGLRVSVSFEIFTLITLQLLHSLRGVLPPGEERVLLKLISGQCLHHHKGGGF